MTTPARIGRYQILGELGRGGMGVVYRGLDPELDREVAIKVIAVEGSEASIGELEARFRREARAAAKVTHPAVVTIYDVGRESSTLFLVMELVRGGSISDRKKAGLYPSAGESLELAARVAEALAAAHGVGLVHRDVKPANILVNDLGQVKVTDFGVARAMGESTELTRTGIVVGSPAYMAPEQLRSSAVDGRADLFALGVVLYELLLRAKPFAADTITTLVYEILNKDPLGDPEVTGAIGPELAGFLRWCLAKNPEDRVPDATTFAHEVRRLAASGALTPVAAVDRSAPTLISQLPLAPTRVSTAPAAHLASGMVPQAAGAAAVAPTPANALGTTTSSGAGSGRSWAIAMLAFAVVLLAGVVAVGLMLRPEVEPESADPLPAVSWGPDRTAALPAVAAGDPAAAASTEVPIIEPQPAPSPLQPVVVPPLTAGGPPATVSSEPAAERFVPDHRPAPTEPAVPVAEPAPSPPVVAATTPPVAAPAPALPPVVATFEAQRAAEFHVSPEETLVAIGGRVIGTADDWDGSGGGQEYVFSGPGSYYATLSLEGYETVRVRIVVRPEADDEVADVDTELERVRRR